MDSFNEILNLELFKISDYSFKLYNIGVFILIFLITRLLIWLIRKLMLRERKSSKIDSGSLFALFQIVKYVIWVIAIGLMLDSIGVKLTVLLAGSAALLVGVGLGLQQTFNDIISGIILLSERSIKYEDILEIDGEVIKIKEIGLRTSTGINRDDISMIIPNSLITTNKVINWSHQTRKNRFRINVGVAYGSDVDKVIDVLVQSAMEHPKVNDRDTVEARLIEFNNSSIDFQLLFFSEEIFRIEKVKSDIRRIIDRKFKENGITIPFPQVDLHVKSDLTKT